MDVTSFLNYTRIYQKPFRGCQSHTQSAKNFNMLSKTYQNLQKPVRRRQRLSVDAKILSEAAQSL